MGIEKRIIELPEEWFKFNFIMDPYHGISFKILLIIGLTLFLFTLGGIFTKNKFRFSSIFIITGGMLAIHISLILNYFPDDAFAHFKIVKNLIHGNGYVFNVNEKIEGTVTPIWHLIIAIGNWIGFDIPSFGRFLSSVFTFGLLISIISFVNTLLNSSLKLKKYQSLLILLIVFNPTVFIYAASGMETTFYAMLNIGLAKQMKMIRYLLGFRLMCLLFHL